MFLQYILITNYMYFIIYIYTYMERDAYCHSQHQGHSHRSINKLSLSHSHSHSQKIIRDFIKVRDRDRYKTIWSRDHESPGNETIIQAFWPVELWIEEKMAIFEDPEN